MNQRPENEIVKTETAIFRCDVCNTVFATAKGHADHNCPENPDDSSPGEPITEPGGPLTRLVDELNPNRFCPFEALDTIKAIANRYIHITNDGLSSAPSEGKPKSISLEVATTCWEILEKVDALRAYITGMEHR